VTLEALLQRDRLVVGGGLAALIVLGWSYTLWLAVGMEAGAMPSLMAMPQRAAWTNLDVLLMLLMWGIMMVAMMTPAAAPTVLLFAAIERRRGGSGVIGRTGAFVAGYLAIWWTFGLAATLVQWALHDAGILSDAMGRVVPWLGAATLAAAGIYQLAPLKAACLRQCRSPISFLSRAWRPGIAGAWRMGLGHGVTCLGCCWALMAVLFVAGVMNLLWIVLLAVLVLIEKTVPAGARIGRLVGVALLAWSAALAIAAVS
jgi:predicted metal-binding membrane protein